MTRKEANTIAIELLKDLNPEVAQHFVEENQKIDAANAKKAAKAAEKAVEDAPLYEALLDALTEDPQSSTDLFNQVSGISSPQKANYMLRKLASDNKCAVTPLKVKGGRSIQGFAKIG
jgi:hypothetical protein